ncbi:MAG: PVC-type heme-binding CxxCH protein [Akkermansiaceae bacterium]
MRNRSLFLLPLASCLVGSSTADQKTMLKEFTLTEGLEATLWAGTEMIHSPLAMDVDARGRVWATEDLQKSGVKGPHARIKILEDTDQDGRADSVKIFGPTFGSKPMGISVFDNVIVVSMAPNIHVYTDVNRDDVFDPAVDKEKIIAKGFHGSGHDHALHAVVPGPSGKWYVNHGNIGADVVMSDGREIHASSYYSQNPQSIGKKSFDGRLYVGGFGLRMNPDGSGAEVIFQNARNAHAMSVNSFGDIFQADNDDPTHARAAWVMEHANYGYASLEDGNRSWEDSAKTWEKKTVTAEIMKNAYERHSKSSLRLDEGHWREHFPGVTPPGNLWGPGAPTGDYFIEGDELGKGLRGKYLVCETVHRAVFAFTPERKEAQIELTNLDKQFFAADRGSKNKTASGFLPSDVVAGTDGALFVSDWNSHVNARGSGNETGGIFRIAKKGAPVKLPKIDFESTKGLLEALKSPAPGVRWVAQDRLKKHEDAFDVLMVFSKENSDNPYYIARATFILAQLEDIKGGAVVKLMLSSEEEQWRIVAIRALRMAGKESLLPLIQNLVDDPSPAVRRELLAMMRGMKWEEIKKPLGQLIVGYDGKNRWYLEALGSVMDDYKDQVYRELVKPLQPNSAKWDERQKNLAWRIRSAEALADLADCMEAQKVGAEEFRRLAYTFGLCYSDEERRRNLEFMRRFEQFEAFQGENYQETIREFLEKDINDPDPIALTQSYVFPTKFGIPTKLGTIEEISALKPNLDNGRSKVALCMMCHQVGSAGTSFGPDLTNWGQVRDVPTVVRALVDPSAELAHGFDKPLVVTQNGHRLEGVSRGYSWHAGAIRVKTMGGVTLKVPHRRPHAKIEYLKDHSWMPSASAMGLSSQDVRDITAYLRSDIAGEVDSGLVATMEPEFSRGEGPGWVALTGEDFVNVNCHEDTWKWEEGHAWCTGKPTGVIRYRKPLTNFELSLEWMHKQKGGNSGVFVWATPQSINRLMQGQGRLPQGIEVQVLDLGYKEIYEAQYKKKGDWFTSHGDVFPVGPIKMRPFPPVAPNGRRSFPSKETTKGINEWNHYYIRAIDGEVRLWVNGEEVSGGDGISPAAGYLCLESEGAPIEFKNLRLRVHPPFETKLDVEVGTPPPAPKPVSMKGHVLLGVWSYGEHSREFLPDGRCILRNGDDVVWTKRVQSVTPNSATLEGGYTHVLKGEVLNIEDRYKAKRK